MKNQKIERVVNPFIQDCRDTGITMGSIRFGCFHLAELVIRLSLSWIITLRTCSQSRLVVLLGRASDGVVSSGNPVLYRWKDIFPF